MNRRLLLVLLLLLGAGARAEPLAPPVLVYEPELPRRPVQLPRLDDQHLAVGAYLGMMSVEDFGSSALRGVSLSLHPRPAWFLEMSLGKAVVRDEDFRRLGLAIFPRGTVPLESRALLLGYQLLPGEVHLGRRRSALAAAFVLFGAGSLRFAGQHWLTRQLGLGLRLLPNRWLAVQASARAQQYRGSLLGAEKYAHNVELRFGLAVYF